MIPTRRFKSLQLLADRVGYVNAGKLALSPLLPRSYEMPLTPPGFNNCLWCRSGKSSDPYVFRQIFVIREYSPIKLDQPQLIIDCGANVGYSSAYFLETFPSAFVVSVEPDPGNVKLLRKNLLRFKDRAEIIEGGIWSSVGSLVTVFGEFADGREWATKVRTPESSESGNTPAFDIPSIIPARFNRVDLLKIDIEGSEVELFRNNAERWLPMVDNIAIELHSPEAADVFFRALQNYHYGLEKSSELTICRNLRIKD
jgi:FkbM family methyltransferase